MQPEQSFATHRRFHPWFHFFAVPVLTINLLVHIGLLIRYPSLVGAWGLFVAAALIVTVLLARSYSLRQQDRIIRLEEQMRLQNLLPTELRPRINELKMSQLIALRFCSDEELAEVASAVLAGEIRSQDEIKKRIRKWRPDYHRI